VINARNIIKLITNAFNALTIPQAFKGNRFWTVAKTLTNHKRFAAVLTLSATVLVAAAMIIPTVVDAQSKTKKSGKLASTPTPTPSPTGSPADYTDVRSALGGVTHLMRQDDVVVNLGGYTPANGTGYTAATLSGITTANSKGTQNYDGFEIPQECDSCPYATLYNAQDTTVTTGRFFHTSQDTVVSYPSRRQNQDLVDIMTGTRNANGNASFQWNTSQPLPYGTNSTTVSQGYPGDFNGDGYDDLLMVYYDYTVNQAGNARARIATAKDVNDPSQGFDFGTESNLGGISEGIRATAIGDFNGDGQLDIANLRVQNDLDLWLTIFSVDPQTLQISYQQEVVVETLPDFGVDQFQLVAGTFTGAGNQQLVVANQSGTSKNIKLRVFDFAQGSYLPVVEQTYDSGTTATNIKLLTSKFDWGSPYDVISFMQTTANGWNSKSYVYLLTVDPGSYAITQSNVVDVQGTYGGYLPAHESQAVALDIAVGNFNNQKPNPADPSLRINDPNLQLAVAIAYDAAPAPNRFAASTVNIIQVIDQQTGKMSLAPVGTIPVFEPNSTTADFFTKLTINAADLQGRSLRLGAGHKIAIDKASPTLILAQPPLHVDWAPLNLSSPNPTVVNLSFANDRFNATYTTTDSTNNTSSNTKTTGWGFSGEESIGESFTLGQTDGSGNLENGVKASETFTAQQELDHSLETTNGSSTTTTQSIAQATGTNDVVWFQDGITYLYSYDVIGQKTCPSDIPNCADSEKIPLTVMVSAPGPTSTQYLSGEALEWYQPTWENGNVLSYPANNNQLLKYMPNTSVFGSATQRTDNAVSSFTTTWAGTQSQGQNVGYSQVFKEDSDTNIEVAAGESVWGTGISEDTNLSFDFGGSDSLSTLRTSSSTIESAKGMTVSKNVNFPDSNVFGYNFSGVIFGKTAPLSYFDGTDPHTPGSGLPPVDTNLTIFGPMRSAFTVDPLANNQGGWWAHSYTTAPDIALNHPNRWSQNKIGSTTPVPSNCLDTNDGYMDCATQKTRQPSDPWDDQFHSMRGFFIFKAGDADLSVPNNQGMQQQTATAGDQLSLQARVYNYSLKQMPAGTQVKVRFYGMPWDTTTMVPKDYVDASNPGGASFLIGETTLTPIPAWNNNTDDPNYSLATVNFDTTGRDDQDLVFWVAVWMEDANGNLVGELPGKGLTALPTTLSSPSFFQMTGLEPTTANNWKESDSDPDMTSFSNNVGIYKQPFYIASKGLGATPSGSTEVSVRKVDVRKQSIDLGQSVEVFGSLHNGSKGKSIDGLSVYFYDGDPATGGKLFDIDRVAHVRDDADYKVRARFTPKTCGMHDIYVKAMNSAMEGDTGASATQLRVRCTIPPNQNYLPTSLSVKLIPGVMQKSDMVPVTAEIQSFDTRDPRPDVRLIAITYKQASDAKNDVAEADFGTDDRAFLLRPGQGKEGNVYEVLYSATNWMGSVTYAKAYITLGPNKDQPLGPTKGMPPGSIQDIPPGPTKEIPSGPTKEILPSPTKGRSSGPSKDMP